MEGEVERPSSATGNCAPGFTIDRIALHAHDTAHGRGHRGAVRTRLWKHRHNTRLRNALRVKRPYGRAAVTARPYVCARLEAAAASRTFRVPCLAP